MRYLLTLLLLIPIGCATPPPVSNQVERPARQKVVKTVVAKESPVESQINWVSTLTRDGIHTQSVTVYYVIFDDGTKVRYPVEKWAVLKVGDKVEFYK